MRRFAIVLALAASCASADIPYPHTAKVDGSMLMSYRWSSVPGSLAGVITCPDGRAFCDVGMGVRWLDDVYCPVTCWSMGVGMLAVRVNNMTTWADASAAFIRAHGASGGSQGQWLDIPNEWAICFMAGIDGAGTATGSIPPGTQCTNIPPVPNTCEVTGAQPEIDHGTQTAVAAHGAIGVATVNVECTRPSTIRFRTVDGIDRIELMNGLHTTLSVDQMRLGTPITVSAGVQTHEIRSTLDVTGTPSGAYNKNAVIIIDIL